MFMPLPQSFGWVDIIGAPFYAHDEEPVTVAARLRHAVAILSSLLVFGSAVAAPDEIQVYTGEMDDPGEFGLELHVNWVPDGAKKPSYPGEKPSNHMLQVTPEFSYGITKEWEAGLYVPFAMAPDGSTYNNGLRGRIKFVPEHREDGGFYWGFNTEVGYFNRRVSESFWGMELRPILGYDDGVWMASFNPILDLNLSSNAGKQPNFEPAFKLGRTVVEGVRAGFEYYGDFGPLAHISPANERAHYLFGVLDINRGDIDLNIGIGKGYQAATDQWVVKAIVALPFK